MTDEIRHKSPCLALLIDIAKHQDGNMTKAELTARWRGYNWPASLREWAKWVWREAVK